MSAPDRTPDPSAPPLESPIATVPPECVSAPCEMGEGITVTPAPMPDELADTGAFDVAAGVLGALVLLYAGGALLGRGKRAR